MAVVKVTHPAVGVRGGDRAPSGERIRTHAAGFKKPQTQMLSAQEPPAKGMPPPGLAGTCGPGPTDGSGTRPAGTVRGWPRPPHPGFSLSCWPSRAGILPAGWSQAGPSWGLFLPTRALFTLKHVGSHRPASLQRPGPARPVLRAGAGGRHIPGAPRPHRRRPWRRTAPFCKLQRAVITLSFAQTIIAIRVTPPLCWEKGLGAHFPGLSPCPMPRQLRLSAESRAPAWKTGGQEAAAGRWPRLPALQWGWAVPQGRVSHE